MLAWYVDPTVPTLTRSLPLTGGTVVLNPYWLGVLFVHLVYSVALAAVYTRSVVSSDRLATVATCADVLFGAAIALVTDGATSLYYVFFAFAVLSVGLRGGLRTALAVTGFSLTFYTIITVVSAPTNPQFYVMRAAYLAMTGYLVGYLGQERMNQEKRYRVLDATVQRERIARSLHDGYAQALAGVNLRLESCRQLFKRGRHDDALNELAELQTGVNREHDELRAYIHSLVERDATPVPATPENGTRFAVSAHFTGHTRLIEHVLHIMLEGARNVTRHARAGSAEIRVRIIRERLMVAIDDDGVGFDSVPWSIASRIAEVGGEVTLDDDRPGGHLRVWLPLV